MRDENEAKAVILQLLSDGNWHTAGEIVAAVSSRISPELACRICRQYGRHTLLDVGQQIRYGKTRLIGVYLNKWAREHLIERDESEKGLKRKFRRNHVRADQCRSRNGQGNGATRTSEAACRFVEGD